MMANDESDRILNQNLMRLHNNIPQLWQDDDLNDTALVGAPGQSSSFGSNMGIQQVTVNRSVNYVGIEQNEFHTQAQYETQYRTITTEESVRIEEYNTASTYVASNRMSDRRITMEEADNLLPRSSGDNFANGAIRSEQHELNWTRTRKYHNQPRSTQSISNYMNRNQQRNASNYYRRYGRNERSSRYRQTNMQLHGATHWNSGHLIGFAVPQPVSLAVAYGYPVIGNQQWNVGSLWRRNRFVNPDLHPAYTTQVGPNRAASGGNAFYESSTFAGQPLNPQRVPSGENFYMRSVYTTEVAQTSFSAGQQLDPQRPAYTTAGTGVRSGYAFNESSPFDGQLRSRGNFNMHQSHTMEREPEEEAYPGNAHESRRFDYQQSGHQYDYSDRCMYVIPWEHKQKSFTQESSENEVPPKNIYFEQNRSTEHQFGHWPGEAPPSENPVNIASSFAEGLPAEELRQVATPLPRNYFANEEAQSVEQLHEPMHTLEEPVNPSAQMEPENAAGPLEVDDDLDVAGSTFESSTREVYGRCQNVFQNLKQKAFWEEHN